MAQDKRRAIFLRALELTAHVGKACEQAKLARRTAYNWRMEDEEFATSWEAAQELGTDALEDEAVRRARYGVSRKKFTSRGEAVIDPASGEQYVEHDYSDVLLIFMLKARRPDKFKDRQEISGVPGKPIEVIEILRSKPKALPALDRMAESNANGSGIH